MIQNSVTTWQAYNLWGGYSLYYGKTGDGGQDFANRARVVSFDRPYPQTWAQGCGRLLRATSSRCSSTPSDSASTSPTGPTSTCTSARSCWPTTGACSAWATTSTGRPRCATAPPTPSPAAPTWPSSAPTPATARSGFEPSPVGPNRLEVCYKDAAGGPDGRPATRPLTTVNWNQAPVNDPRASSSAACTSRCGPTTTWSSPTPRTWFSTGAGSTDGSACPRSSRASTTATCRRLPGPKNVDVLAHSPSPARATGPTSPTTRRPERRRCPGHGNAVVRREALQHHRPSPATSSRRPSPGSPTSSSGPWRTSTVRSETGRRQQRGRPRATGGGLPGVGGDGRIGAAHQRRIARCVGSAPVPEKRAMHEHISPPTVRAGRRARPGGRRRRGGQARWALGAAIGRRAGPGRLPRTRRRPRRKRPRPRPPRPPPPSRPPCAR